MTEARSAVISLNNIVFSWCKGKPVLDIPEFTVMQGEKVFVRGPSGSGKTTLLGILGGVLVPEQGSVNVLGADLCGLSSAQRDQFRADHIGFIFQMFNLIPYLSLLENVTLPLGFAGKRQLNLKNQGVHPEAEACRLLNHLQLSDQQQLQRKVTDLSIGQQQRVAAARALIGRPELVIADEPTSALDADTRASFIKLLFAECEKAGSTLVFVSHDHALESLFDRTLSLGDVNRAGLVSAHQGGGV